MGGSPGEQLHANDPGWGKWNGLAMHPTDQGEWMLAHGANRENKLVAFRYKPKGRNFGEMSFDLRGGISEREMPRMRNEIPKWATYNKYGDAARQVGISALVGRGDL